MSEHMHRDLFRELLDDAALFPPGSAAMPDAVRDHAAHRPGPRAEYVGPFVCRASRLAELAAAAAAHPAADYRVAVVVRGGRDELDAALAAFPDGGRLRLEAVEFAPSGLPPEHAAAELAEALPDGVRGCLETPWWPPDRRDALLDGLAGARRGVPLRAKLRTGGTDASAHPDERRLAAAIAGCVQRDVPFKCTAGLHHAVRRTDPETGFEQHGFLNVLLAAAAAGDTGEDGLRELLAEREPKAVADAVRALAPDAAAAARARFTSFGTCSIDEPLTDLVDLGLVPPTR